MKTENLTFKYKKGQSDFKFPDINLKEGEELLILGKSGIGKSTFLYLLAGLLKPNSGKVVLNGVNINSLNSGSLDKFRGQNIGFVFQKNHAIRSLNVFENLKARLHFSQSSMDVNHINELLFELGLSTYKKYKPKELSEGQLQRLGIALSVIHKPKVLLADEPTSSLDDENCIKVIELLKKQSKKYKANLIVITHDYRIKSFFQNAIEL